MPSFHLIPVRKLSSTGAFAKNPKMPIGPVVEPRFAEPLRQKLYTLIGQRTPEFPAAQISNLDKRDLNTLIQNDYLVSLKGSGIRALLMIQRDGCFLYCKNKNFYYNEFKIPGKGGLHFDTIIDGEFIIETNTFMCFDLICIDGVKMVERSASTRLGILLEDIIKLITPPTPFKLEMHKYERSYGLELFLKQDCKELVFTPIKKPYTIRPNSDLKLFNWLNPEFQTISFKLKVIWDDSRKPHYQLLICDGSVHKYFDDFTLSDQQYKDWKSLLNLDGKIVDCKFDKSHETRLWENGYATTIRKGGWVFVKFRQ